MSATGIFVRSDDPPLVGGAVALKLRLDGHAPDEVVAVEGEVVLAARNPGSPRSGFAVKFAPGSVEAARRFHEQVHGSTVRTHFDAQLGRWQLEGPDAAARFEILEMIGSGATSEVFRARDLTHHRVVALKILRLQVARDDEIVARLHREAELVGLIHHPRIAQVHESGVLDGRPYLCMELVEGSPLSHVLFDHHHLSEPEVVRLLLDAAEGLAAAHRAGVVHRDLKPSNLMVTPDGRAKVLDFGIARGRLQSRITHAGAFIGTPIYAAPEQLVGATASPRTDVYALGCVLFRALTGVEVQDAATLEAILDRQYSGQRTSVRDHRPELGDAIDRIVARCLATDPADRFLDAGAVHEALLALPSPVASVDLETVDPCAAVAPRRALLGEHDEAAVPVIASALAHDGFDTRVVGNGFALVESALRQPPTLVVVNASLPGIEGLEVIQILRSHARTAKLPLVLTSASESDRRAVEFSGIAAFVTRPVSTAAIVAALRALGSAGTRATDVVG
ncbi:MAG: protein kinase [Deltaproteobacteria bacterium]|nr:protein kinase [Deltaproteobacteria bacterium]